MQKINSLKNISLIIVVVTVITGFISCTGNPKAGLEHYKKVYKQAMNYSDFIEASDAMYQMWVDDTANAVSYKDTLANLYFKRGLYLQAVVLGKDVLAKHPDDDEMTGLVATSDQNINNLNEALPLYQKLYAKFHNLFQVYQIATIEFALGKGDECSQAISQIIADPNSATQKIVLNDPQGQQQVPYKAAALNIRGVMEKSLKQYDAAKKDFQDALTIYPDFILAKNNLNDLNKK